MTDRYNALVVVLDKDTREDDAKPLIEAIRLLRGVASVGPNVTDIVAHVAKMRAVHELTGRLWDVLYPGKGAGS